mgnify:CR=1 FL=1
MANELRFDDRVAIVTGAGNGLGRSHALLLASRGAKVVVNDLGGAATGGGASASAADLVVEQIKAAGGEAVANHDSVEDGAAIVQTALDAFGRIDIVVNNAGILRDSTFQKMTEQDWDLIYRVHVLGSFRVTHAAWPHMRAQEYGRIVMTASAAGIYGNFGQANYAMAKLGLTGLSNTLAVEGRKKNILVNTIAPLAGSRLTETILPKSITEALTPDLVSPLVALLVHENCEETGGLYEVGGGFFGKLRWERAAGKMFRLGRAVTPEAVANVWDDVVDFEHSEHPSDINASMAPIMANLSAGPSKGGNEFVDVDQALGFEFPEHTSSYDEGDLALYALGVGAANDPLDPQELALVYEMSGDGFKALPTFGVIPSVNMVLDQAKRGITAPGLSYGLDRVLHGEQYTELSRPLPSKATLTHRMRIKDIFDKGKGALIVNETHSYDEQGEQLIYNEMTVFVRGAGGWGGDRGPSGPVNEPPERPADAVIEEAVPSNQALLYRLSGDWNPLHADPNFAKNFGFDKPILHGLCTYGHVGRHVIKAFCGGDPRYFKSIRVRFAATVLPGQTLVTEMWKESDTRIVLRCSVKETGKAVITNAAVELWTEIPTAKPVATAPAAAVQAGPPAVTSGDVFVAIGDFLTARPDMPGKIKTVYQFKLSAPQSVWTIDLKDTGAVTAGAAQPAGCTLELSDADFLGMCAGELDAMGLFSSGKLSISGDLMASQKLEFLQKIDPKAVLAIMEARLGGAAAPAADTGPAEVTSGDVFVAIGDFLAARPDMPGKIKTVYQFALSSPESLWTIDLKDTGAVTAGATLPAGCTLNLSDADFLGMCAGELDAMGLFSSGKLTIAGDLMASQKLEFLQKIDPKAVLAIMEARLGGSSEPAPAPAAPVAAPKAATAPGLFDALAEEPPLTDAGGIIQFVVREPDGLWYVDLTEGGVQEGTASIATATLTLTDADLAQLASGEQTAQSLFQRGRLQIEGDLATARNLDFLRT